MENVNFPLLNGFQRHYKNAINLELKRSKSRTDSLGVHALRWTLCSSELHITRPSSHRATSRTSSSLLTKITSNGPLDV